MNVMLDECVTEGPALALISFFSTDDPPIRGEFQPTYFQTSGLKDEVWPIRMVNELGKDWLVITGDRDSRRKSREKRIIDGAPLYTILPKLGITAVYLSNALCRQKGQERVRAITYLWPDIKKFYHNNIPGSRAGVQCLNRTFVLRPNY